MPKTLADVAIYVGQPIRLGLHFDETDHPSRRYYVTINTVRVRPELEQEESARQWFTDLVKLYMEARRRLLTAHPVYVRDNRFVVASCGTQSSKFGGSTGSSHR